MGTPDATVEEDGNLSALPDDQNQGNVTEVVVDSDAQVDEVHEDEQDVQVRSEGFGSTDGLDDKTEAEALQEGKYSDSFESPAPHDTAPDVEDGPNSTNAHDQQRDTEGELAQGDVLPLMSSSHAEAGSASIGANVKDPLWGKRAGPERSHDSLDGGTRAKGVAVYESHAHAVFKDEYDELLSKEIDKLSSKIRDRLREQKIAGMTEEERAQQQLKFEKIYGMPAIRTSLLPRREWLQVESENSDLRQNSSQSDVILQTEKLKDSLWWGNTSQAYSLYATTPSRSLQSKTQSRRRLPKRLSPLVVARKEQTGNTSGSILDEVERADILSKPRSESVPLVKPQWNCEFNSKTLEAQSRPVTKRHFEKVQPRRLPPTPFGAQSKEQVAQALRAGEGFPRRAAHNILIALKHEMERRREEAVGYPRPPDEEEGMTEEEELLLYKAFRLEVEEEQEEEDDDLGLARALVSGASDEEEQDRDDASQRIVSLANHRQRGGSVSKACFLALLQGMGIVQPPRRAASSLEASLAEDPFPLSLKELLVAEGRESPQGRPEARVIQQGQHSQTCLEPLSRLRAARLVVDSKNYQKDHGGVLWMLERIGWDDFLSSVGSIACEAVVVRGWASVGKRSEEEEEEGEGEGEAAKEAGGGGEALAHPQRGDSQQRPASASGMLNWKTGIVWSEYQPTPEEMEEVRAVFRQFGRNEWGTLPDIKAALLLNGYSFHFVMAVMQQAAPLAEKPSGRIGVLDFARVLLKHRADAAIRIQPPTGMSNVIRLLVVRGGNRELVMPCISMLQDKVFPRLVDTATQLGGTLVVEHLSLADHPKHWHCRDKHPSFAAPGSPPPFKGAARGSPSGSPTPSSPTSRRPRRSIVEAMSAMPEVLRSAIQSHTRITADQAVEYAARCKTESGSVWFLFVLDDSVTEACLPSRVPAEELERVREALEWFPNSEMLDLVDVCYRQDTHHENEDYGLVLDREDELVSLHKMLVDAVVGDGQFAGIGRLGKGLMEARSVVAKFLVTSHAFQALEKLPEVAPVFAVVREFASNSKDAGERSELEEHMSRMPLANVFRYRVISDQKSRPNRQTNKKFWSVAQALSCVKMMSPHSPTRRKSALDILATVEVAVKKDHVTAAATSTTSTMGHSLTTKRWLQLVEHDVHDVFFSVVAKVITDAAYLSEAALHEMRLKALLFDAEDEELQMQHVNQESAVDGVVAYLHHDILIGLRVAQQEEEMVEPMHVKVQNYLEAFRKTILHDELAEEWHFPVDKELEDRLQRAQSPQSPTRPASPEGKDLSAPAREEGSRWEHAVGEQHQGQHHLGQRHKARRVARVVMDVFRAEAEFCGFEQGLRQLAFFTVGAKEWEGLSWPERLAVVQVVSYLCTVQGVQGVEVGEAQATAEEAWSRVEREAPLLVVGESGSGRSTAVALALQKGGSLGQLLAGEGREEQNFQASDGRVTGLTFLRVVGASTGSVNGRHLLRSLVLEMREALLGEGHLQSPVPATMQGLEAELFSLMVQASTNCPLVVVVDGLEKLRRDDPVRSMLWIPKVLPAHARLIVSATTEFYTPQVLQRFPTNNIIHLGNLDESSAEQFLVDSLKKSHRKLDEADRELIMQTHSMAPSLELLRIYAAYAKLWNSCNASVQTNGRLPLTALEDGERGLELNSTFFSPMGNACLSLLALSRHGLSEFTLQSVMALIILRADEVSAAHAPRAGGRQSIARTLRAMLSGGTPWQVLFDTEMMAIQPLARAVAHGKSVVLRIDVREVREAVCGGGFFLSNRELLSEALMSVLADQHLRAVPLYQKVAELPRSQLSLAEVTRRMPDEGPGAIRETLCNLSFLKVKVEVGLIEDLIRDFEDFFSLVAAGKFEVSAMTLSSTRAFLDMIMRNIHILVKPFHAQLLSQLWEAHSCDKESIRPGESRRWSTAEDEETAPQCFMHRLTDFDVRVECVARIQAKYAILCCTAASGPAFATFACGLGNGDVVVYNGLLYERSCKWTAHETAVTSLEFVRSGAYGQEGPRGAPLLLLTASKKGYIKAWDCEQYAQVFYFAPFVQAAGESAFLSGGGAGAAAMFEGLEARMGKWTLENLKEEGVRIDEMMAGDFRHSVSSLAVSRALDGRYFVAVGSYTGSIKLWEVSVERSSCFALPALEGHAAAVHSVAFHERNPWLVSASSDRTAKIWDCGADPPAFLQEMQNGAPTYWASFRGDSVISSGTGFIREWQLHETEAPHAQAGSAAEQGGLKGTRKLNLVKMGSMRLQSPFEGNHGPLKRQSKAADRLKKINSFVLKNMSGGKSIRESLHGGTNPTSNLIDMRAVTTKLCAVFKDKQFLMAFCDLKLYCWDLRNDTAQSIPMFNHVTAACHTDDGRVITASQDNCLRVWVHNEAARPNLQAPPSVSLAVPSLAALVSGRSPPPQKLGRGAAGHQVHGRILRPQRQDDPSPPESPQAAPSNVGLLQPTGAHPLPVENLTISHDGTSCLTVGGGDALLWDTPTGLLRSKFGEGTEWGTVSCATFSPPLPADHPLVDSDASLLFVAWSTYHVNLWDVSNLNQPPILEIGAHNFHIRKIRIDNEGRFVATASMDKTVKVWNIWNNPKRHVVRLEDVEKEAHKDPKAKRLAALLQTRSIVGTVAKRLRSRTLLEGLHQDSVLDIALCPIGTRVASASADHSVAVWSLEALGQGERLWIGNHGSFVQAVAFSPPTGKLLASAGGDRMCRVWDVEKGVKIHLLKTTGALTLVQFSPSGTMVAAGGLKGALGVWSVSDGKEVKGKMHPGMCESSSDVSSLNWSPDSRALVVSSTLGELFAWDVQVGRFLAAFSCCAVNAEDTGAFSRFGGSFGENFENPGIACAAVHFSPAFPTGPPAGSHAARSRKGSVLSVGTRRHGAPPPSQARTLREPSTPNVLQRETSSASAASAASAFQGSGFNRALSSEAGVGPGRASTRGGAGAMTTQALALHKFLNATGGRARSSEDARSNFKRTQSDASSATGSDEEGADAASVFRRSFGEETSTICVCGDSKGRVHILTSNGLEATPKDFDRRDGPHMHFKLHHVTHHVEQLHAFDAATVTRRAKEADHAKFIMGATERHAALRAAAGVPVDGIQFERAGGSAEKADLASQKRAEAEEQLLRLMSQHKADDNRVFGWLAKLNSLAAGSDPADWRDRLCFSVQGEFKYISEKQLGKAVVICNFRSVQRIDMTSFTCPGREFAFQLWFFDGSDITFAAESEEERERWTNEIVRVLEEADEEEEGQLQDKGDTAHELGGVAEGDEDEDEESSGGSEGAAGRHKEVTFGEEDAAEDARRAGGGPEDAPAKRSEEEQGEQVAARAMELQANDNGRAEELESMLSEVEELNRRRQPLPEANEDAEDRMPGGKEDGKALVPGTDADEMQREEEASCLLEHSQASSSTCMVRQSQRWVDLWDDGLDGSWAPARGNPGFRRRLRSTVLAEEGKET